MQKGITDIDYNHLNLPERVYKDIANQVQYLYGGYEHTGEGTAGTMAHYSIPTVLIDRPGYIYTAIPKVILEKNVAILQQ